MLNPADELNKFEEDIRDLKVEYEKYFGGGRSRPPADIEWRIQEVIKRYGDRGGTLTFSVRFRYVNLAQTYANYQEMIRKKLKRREEGTVQRHFGAAAREIERERARRRGEAPVRPDRKKGLPISISTKDPAHDSKKVEALYEAFVEAKKIAGESIEHVTLEKFQHFVQEKTAHLKKQKNAEEVEYIVSVEDKHARLKARVKS